MGSATAPARPGGLGTTPAATGMGTAAAGMGTASAATGMGTASSAADLYSVPSLLTGSVRREVTADAVDAADGGPVSTASACGAYTDLWDANRHTQTCLVSMVGCQGVVATQVDQPILRCCQAISWETRYP